MHRVVLERPDHLEAGTIADVREPRVAMATEVALQDEAVLRAVEQRAPLLELEDAVGCFLRVDLRHAPVVEQLAAAHRVAEVDFPVVLLPHVAQRRRDAALGHDGMRLPEQRLADERGAHAHRAGLDRRAQPRAPRADDDDVVLMTLRVTHVLPLLASLASRPALLVGATQLKLTISASRLARSLRSLNRGPSP